MDLQASRYFQEYLKLTGELFIALDTAGIVTHANPRACEVLGYTENEIVGTNWFETFIPKQTQALVQNVSAQLLDDNDPQSKRHVNPVLTRSGEERMISWRNVTMRNDEGVIVGHLSSGEDITDQLIAQDALHESESKYQQLVELAPHGIEELDLTGTITYANPAYYGFYGFTREEFVGKKIWDLVSENPDKLKKYFEYLIKEQPEPTPYRGTYFKKNGELFDLQVDWDYQRDHNGNLTGFLSMITDITDQVHTQRALQKSEGQFRAIMNSLKETSIVIYDLNSRVTDIWYDHEFDGRYGNLAVDFIGKRPTDVLPPDQARDRIKNIQHVIATGSKAHSEILSSLPGGDFWFDSTISPLIDEDGTTYGAVGFFRDITERKKIENEHLESENRLQSIMSALYETFIVVYDRDATILNIWTTPELDERYRANAVDTIGKCPQDLLTKAHASERENLIKSVYDTGTKQLVEYMYTLASGDFWFEASLSPMKDASGKTVGVVSFVHDVTSRKTSEEALVDLNAQLESQVESRTETLSVAISDLKFEAARRLEIEDELRTSEERYRSLIENSTDWVWEKNLSLHHTYSNDRVFEILGYTPSDLAELDFKSLFHPDDTKKNIDLFQQCVTAKSGWSNWIKRIRHKDGSYRILESNSTPILDDHGKTIGFRGVDRDITERIQAQEQLRKQQSTTQHVARLSTMGATVSGLAHELNQPLSALAIYADACVKMVEPKTNIDLTDTLSKIANQAERAGKIIHRVQQFTRKGEPHQSSYDINTLVHESLEFIAAEAKLNKIEITLELMDPSPTMIGDPIQIQQVILNLIRNAFDSMKKAEYNAHVLTITSTVNSNSNMLLTIADTGGGFKQEEKSAIFDSFFTTKSEGMGLGLSISRTIVENHGGQLVATLNTKRGATFSISLPVEKIASNV